MKSIVVAGLAGGLALFFWEAVAHMILPLGEAGIQAIANEQAVMTALKDNIRQPGLYLFPAPNDLPGTTAGQKAEAIAKAQERWRTGPSGMLIFHPSGTDSISARQLVTQLGGDMAAMLLAAVVLWHMAPASYPRRAALVGILGLLPALESELPNWNWYGLPAMYLLAQAAIHLVGFVAGGLVVAAMARPGAPPHQPRSSGTGPREATAS